MCQFTVTGSQSLSVVSYIRTYADQFEGAKSGNAELLAELYMFVILRGVHLCSSAGATLTWAQPLGATCQLNASWQTLLF